MTIYSGRSESLVGPLIERFEAVSGISVRIRYAGTAELAAAILEEGERSRADVFYSQDAGALAALADAGALVELPDDVVADVPSNLSDALGRWVATSGRARVLIVSTERVPDPPQSVFDLVDEQWRGRVGWAPTNASFQAFVTAMRQIHGEQATEEWLRDMVANDVVEFPRNSAIVQAVGDGEIDIGLVNHYYLYRFIADDPEFPAFNHFTDPGAAGGLVNVAGVAVLDASRNTENALRFVRFLLSEAGQAYFRDQTSEYPVASGVEPRRELIPLSELDPPSLALTSLADLEGTIALLQRANVLP
ncbi:MAG: iron ABC transporter substrate-binding protein [Chloroflexi bacterium]|nr:iron ABC transporter substrate-binding protein [Chloroflexota bacterium]